MVWVDGEPELGPSFPGQVVEERVGDLNQLAALLADEMPVHRRRQVVGRRPVPEMGMDVEAQPLELIEVAVDGGDVDVGSLGLDLVTELLGRPVTFGGEEGTEEEASRRGHPTTVLAYELEGILERDRLGGFCRFGRGATHVAIVPGMRSGSSGDLDAIAKQSQ